MIHSLKNLFDQEASFDSLLKTYRVRADRIMVGMMVFLFLVSLVLAPLEDTWSAVFLIGLPTLALSLILARFYPGELITRLYMGAAFMVFTGLFIHQNAGDIEAHFSAFGLIGVLLYYRDWRTILMATLVIYLHHLVLGYAQTLGVPVYVFDSDDFWRLFWVHVAYFLPFIGMMIYLSIWLRREGYGDHQVMAIAQDIIHGNLMAEVSWPEAQLQNPLIQSVLQMKNRLLDLLRVMPIPVAVIRMDNGTVVNANEVWINKLGELPMGSRVQDSLIESIPGTWQKLLDDLNASQENILDKSEIGLRYPDGREALCEVSIILHEEVHPVMAILTLEDITQRRQTEKTMERLAFNDMLTGLANRTYLLQHLEGALSNWKKHQTGFAVLMMDLDGFKPINDTFGHNVGDEVLRIIGKRLLHKKRETDLIARLGGDEFVVVLNHCEGYVPAQTMAQRVIDALLAPMYIELEDHSSTNLEVGVSVGIAHIMDGAQGIEALLKQADIALYRAKKAGKRQAVIYTPG